MKVFAPENLFSLWIMNLTLFKTVHLEMHYIQHSIHLEIPHSVKNFPAMTCFISHVKPMYSKKIAIHCLIYCHRMVFLDPFMYALVLYGKN